MPPSSPMMIFSTAAHLLIVAAMTVLPTLTTAMQFRVGSWNLRYDSQPDNITVADSIASLPDALDQIDYLKSSNVAEQPWSTRRLRVAQTILSENLVIAGGYIRL